MKKTYYNKAFSSIKIIMLLLTTLLYHNNVICQWSKRAYDYVATTASKTIIKEYTYPYTISYIETAENNYFTYTDIDISQSIVYKEINRIYSINDFVIRNDSIFFCGKNNSGKGVIGFFNINDFFFGSGTYELFDDFHAQSTILSFNKVISYKSLISPVHIISIGETEQDMSCITDMYYDPTSSSWKYKSGDFINGGNETFKDITLTNKYVVTAGYYSAPVRYMSLRRFKREDILSSATLKDFVNVYNGPISNALYCPDDNILLSTYHDDTVVTACFWNYPIVQNTVSGIIYAWHDLTNITLPSSMTKIIKSFDYSNLSDCDIRELITDYTSQYAFLLHKKNHNYIVDELHTNITSSGSMLICYDTINNYTSIDFHNIYKYILNGFEIADPTKVLFSWVTPNINLSCLTRDFTSFQQFQIITNNHIYSPLKIYSSNIVLNKLKAKKGNTNIIDKDCVK